MTRWPPPRRASHRIASYRADDRRRGRPASGSVSFGRPVTSGPPKPAVVIAPIDGRKVKVFGRVRWVTPFGGLRDASPGMGVELVGTAADKREVLGALLARRARRT